jgi:uncharacterized protein YdhG (YjbR/CyaY superfamily)
MMEKHTTVDSYIAAQAPTVQAILLRLRSIVFSNVPSAVESFSYGMPAYKLGGKPLIYFAAFSSHIGVYATPKAHETFASALAGYKQGKGSVQFPLKEAIPYELIEEIVKFKRNQLLGNS